MAAAKDAFNVYEYTGVIAPGTALLFGCVWVFKEDLGQLFELKEIDLGEFGIFVLLAFVAGHLAQGLGSVLEQLVWGRRGMPTSRVFEPKQQLLTQDQVKRLSEKLFPTDQPKKLSSVPIAERAAHTREIYIMVHSKERSTRVDAFNRTYGLLRGIAAAFVLTAVLVAVKSMSWPLALVSLNWTAIGVLTLLALIALLRMKRFGESYARELLIEYISL